MLCFKKDSGISEDVVERSTPPHMVNVTKLDHMKRSHKGKQ